MAGKRSRERLTRERVVEAALALIDAEGPDGLTMRRLGAELGVQGMALYHHFESKDDLLDAVALRLLGELELPDQPEEWQARIRAVVMAWAALQDRHPRAFPLVYRRRTPETWDVRPTEELFDALRSAGFDEIETANAYLTLIFLLDGALFSRPYPFSTVGDAARYGASVVDPEQFPRYVEIGQRVSDVSWEQVYGLGVDLLISGLEAWLRGRAEEHRP
jgi:AcrR family transcriptional regulator